MPKISVIMGVYNNKNFDLLEKSVKSIITQTFTDWEFIICNDGSVNETLPQLNKIAAKDSRIKVLSYSQNRGLNYALNECLQCAEGEYIARQDDDDISKPERLEKEILFLDEHPEYDLVGTCAEVFDDKGIWGKYEVPEKPSKKDFYWNSPFMHPTIMVRKSTYDALGGYRCAKETRRCEDIDFFMRLYASGKKGYNIQEKLYVYRMDNNPNVKYRPMRYRIDEAIVKFKGYKEMGNLLGGIPFVIKPILIGMIPQKLLYQIKKKRY